MRFFSFFFHWCRRWLWPAICLLAIVSLWVLAHRWALRS